MILDKEVHWKWALFNEAECLNQIKAIEDATARETLWRIMCFTNAEGIGKARVSQLVISYETWNRLNEMLEGTLEYLQIGYVADTRRGEGPPDFMMRIWNELSNPGLPKVKMLNAQRTSRARQRWEEFSAPKGDFWEAAVKRVNKSSFLNGSNDRGWIADFDFMLQPNSVARIMEGKYDDRYQKTNAIEGSSVEALAQLGWSKQ